MPTFSDGHETLQLDTKTTPRRWPPKTETRVETESCLHQPRRHQDKKFKFRDEGETLLAFEVVIETSMQARSILGKPATQKNSNPEVRENTMSPRGGKIYILYRYVSLKKEVRILDFF